VQVPDALGGGGGRATLHPSQVGQAAQFTLGAGEGAEATFGAVLGAGWHPAQEGHTPQFILGVDTI